MHEERLKIWETLFERALILIDSVAKSTSPLEGWSFGGGTVLMRRHHHRFSKDIDIFIPDAQHLPYLTPRLNGDVEALTSNYVESQGSIKLIFREGEIDFAAAGPLIKNPTKIESLFGREVNVEKSAEIVAKKVWHRGADFTARDIFDLAMVAENEPDSLESIKPILQERRDVILDRIKRHESNLRETFAALEVLDYKRNFDECVELTRQALT